MALLAPIALDMLGTWPTTSFDHRPLVIDHHRPMRQLLEIAPLSIAVHREDRIILSDRSCSGSLIPVAPVRALERLRHRNLPIPRIETKKRLMILFIIERGGQDSNAELCQMILRFEGTRFMPHCSEETRSDPVSLSELAPPFFSLANHKVPSVLERTNNRPF